MGPGFWDPPTCNLHLVPFTWDLEPRTFTWNPELGTLHLEPIIWDPGPYMWDPNKKTHFIYQGTVFCVVFYFNVYLGVQKPVSYYSKMILNNDVENSINAQAGK